MCWQGYIRSYYSCPGLKEHRPLTLTEGHSWRFFSDSFTIISVQWLKITQPMIHILTNWVCCNAINNFKISVREPRQTTPFCSNEHPSKTWPGKIFPNCFQHFCFFTTVTMWTKVFLLLMGAACIYQVDAILSLYLMWCSLFCLEYLQIFKIVIILMHNV